MSTSSDNQFSKKKRSLAETPARAGDPRYCPDHSRYELVFDPEDVELMKNISDEEKKEFMIELIKKHKHHYVELGREEN